MKHRRQGSPAPIADKIFDLESAKCDALAHLADLLRRGTGLGAINVRGRRNELRHGLAAARDDDLLAGFDPIEQLAQSVFRLEGTDFSHDYQPNKVFPFQFNRWLACCLACCNSPDSILVG